MKVRTRRLMPPGREPSGCLNLRALALVTVLLTPSSWAETEIPGNLLAAARALKNAAAQDAINRISHEELERQSLGWLYALLEQGEPRFTQWQSEHVTFATTASQHPADVGPFPGAGALSHIDTAAAHGVHGGPLIHFTHFNAEAHRYIRDAGIYDQSIIHRMAARGESLPAPPLDAMVVLTGWWPLAVDQATPMPVWDASAPLRASGANGYLNWRKVALVAPANDTTNDTTTDTAKAPRQFAGRTITSPLALSRDAFYRIKPSPAQLDALMANERFEQASAIALARPMQIGDELALVAFHVLHFGLEEGIWLTYWWEAAQADGENAIQRVRDVAEVDLPAPWHNYRGNMTLSALHPREADGSPNICFNPWFDAVFPDSGQGNGLKANCLGCHLRAGIPAADRVRVVRGRPALEDDNNGIIYTNLLWSLANPRRSVAQDRR